MRIVFAGLSVAEFCFSFDQKKMKSSKWIDWMFNWLHVINDCSMHEWFSFNIALEWIVNTLSLLLLETCDSLCHSSEGETGTTHDLNAILQLYNTMIMCFPMKPCATSQNYWSNSEQDHCFKLLNLKSKNMVDLEIKKNRLF